MTATPPRRNSGARSPRITSGFNLNTDNKQKDLSSNVNRDDDIVELKKNAGANNDNSGLTAGERDTCVRFELAQFAHEST